MDIKSFLEDHGYPILEGNNSISTSANFRGGDNKTALCIYLYDNLVIDFVTGEKYSIKTLISKVLGLDSEDETDEYMAKNELLISQSSKKIEEPTMTKQKILDNSFLEKLKPDHSYWLKRGISIEVLNELRGGVYKDRYYFPVFDPNNQIIGLSSRDLSGKSPSKYRINGEKKNFLYPITCCDSDIKTQKQVILVEGIPNLASLMTCGIRHSLVMFGVDLSFTVINYLLRIPDVKIVISTDNDFAGREAADKIYSKLRKYFDYNQISIKIIDKHNDLNDFLVQEGQEAIRNFYVEESIHS